MKLGNVITGLCLLVLSVGSEVRAEYSAKVSLNSGKSFVVKQLNIRDGRLYLEGGQASTPVSFIKKVDFGFSSINITLCESMFRSGDYKGLERLMTEQIDPVLVYAGLAGNLNDYLVWRLRAQFWSDDLDGAAKSIASLEQQEASEHADIAHLYSALLLLSQDRLDEAKEMFSSVLNPESVSVPMAEYIHGQIAAGLGDYRQAMLHVSQVLAFYSRDLEWMPAATALEARVYQETGQLKKAATVANELCMAYPDTRWSVLGEDIKKNVNQDAEDGSL